MSEAGESPGSGRRQSGTTLIEALVVVAITGMVAMVGFPRMQQGLAILSQRQTVAIIAARLRQARADALRADGAAVFVISADGRAYGEAPGPYDRTPAGVVLTSGPSNTRSARTITFFGDGSSSGGTVWVATGHRVVPVIVAPGAGAVAIGAG